MKLPRKIPKGERIGELRCLNCFRRVTPKKGEMVFKCPNCGMSWRLSWPYPNMPKIRGPVWEEIYPGGRDHASK